MRSTLKNIALITALTIAFAPVAQAQVANLDMPILTFPTKISGATATISTKSCLFCKKTDQSTTD